MKIISKFDGIKDIVDIGFVHDEKRGCTYTYYFYQSEEGLGVIYESDVIEIIENEQLKLF